ncbi:MAG: hypothetical protein WC955_04965 [Elusimicrobiota bacterium]
MKDNVKSIADKALLLALGAAVYGKEKVEKLIDNLDLQSEKGKNDVSELLSEIIDKGKAAKDDLTVVVRKEIAAVLKETNIATKTELEELKAKIKRLEAKLAGK